MKIGIVGLGLMGGSLAKAIKKHTVHTVYGNDSSTAVLDAAMQDGAIDKIGNIHECDLVFVCLYPRDTVEYLLNTDFKSTAIVTDICGVKRFISERVSEKLTKKGIRYVGGHPMAGRELSGFSASNADLFRNASYIICKDEYTDENAVNLLIELAGEIGFSHFEITTPARHDHIIAYTSQLAHVVSNSYVKNKSVDENTGFTAGSFEDLTRVAQLNPIMWAELFAENSDFLVENLDELIHQLKTMRHAIGQKNEKELESMLREGSEIKQRLAQAKGKPNRL